MNARSGALIEKAQSMTESSAESHATADEATTPRRGTFVTMITSAGGVYGLVLVAGMIVISRNITVSSLEALGVVLATLIVFFVAHVYAATIGYLAANERPRVKVGEALRHGLHESAGLLLVGIVPLAALLLGVLGVVGSSESIWIALLIDVALLGALGWMLTATRTRSFIARLGGALLTAALGSVMILLKVLIH